MSHNVKKRDILLVGAGPMATAYARVLAALDRRPFVVGRGVESARKFEMETGLQVLTGGLEALLTGLGSAPESAIICTGAESLEKSTLSLLHAGVNRILCEKPGALDAVGLRRVQEQAAKAQGQVYIGYNRRFYASVAAAKDFIDEDGGLVSFHFDFTERSRLIETLTKAPGVKENWLLVNSSHVIDLAFHLGGFPEELHCSTAGSLPWHPSGARFWGTGRSREGVPFTYRADWEAPGNWSVECYTRKRKILLSPMERLSVCTRERPSPAEVQADYSLDVDFKPGLYRQTAAFLSGKEDPRLPSVAAQAALAEHVCERIRLGERSA